jgi:hypothetical protein
MAVLLYSEIRDRALDRIQANVATDPAFTSAEEARHINEAYADIYEISGGGIVSASHTTIWEVYVNLVTFSTKASISSRIGTVVHLYAATAAVDTAETALYPMLERVEQSRIKYLNRNSDLIYSTPQCYSITRIDETDETRIPRLRLDIFPNYVAGFFYPIDYIPQFTEIDSATNTQPSVSDIESRDIALLAAARMAPLIGASELVPSIVMDLSERTRAALDRKLKALMDASQDR